MKWDYNKDKYVCCIKIWQLIQKLSKTVYVALHGCFSFVTQLRVQGKFYQHNIFGKEVKLPKHLKQYSPDATFLPPIVGPSHET